MWSSDLSEEETNALIEKAASQIVKRKLQTPAILFIEMHKPLANVGAQSALVMAPFIVPFLGFDFVNDYSRLFSVRQNVDKLLDKIEELSNQKPAKEI